MMRFFIPLFFVLGLAARAELDPGLVSAAQEKWGKAISELEARDRQEKDPAGAILFVGSSSIRLWESITEDMAPYPVIQRGYGGAKFSDGAVFAERLIRPHTFRAVVMFFGNDISGKDGDAEPEDVVKWFLHLAAVAKRAQPGAEVFCIGVTPTPSRWGVWPEVARLNAALAKACDEDERLNFIATADHFLGADGRPQERWFREDRLHLNASGYHRWAGIITRQLDRVLQEGGESGAETVR